MTLTAKQEAFCQAVLTEANTSDAYRKVYGGQNMAPQTVNRRAKELMDNGKIKARLAELRAPAVEKAQITLEQHLNDLKTLRDSAADRNQYSAAITAEMARGRVSGFYDNKTSEDPDDQPTPVKIVIDVVDARKKRDAKA